VGNKSHVANDSRKEVQEAVLTFCSIKIPTITSIFYLNKKTLKSQQSEKD